MENLEKYFMEEAIKEAEIAFKEDEVPVGCVLVYKNKIVGRYHNECKKRNDILAHAEMLCVQNLCRSPLFFEKDLKLYVTLEPCLMCTGAILHSNISEIIFALPSPKDGALYSNKTDLIINGSKEGKFKSRLGYCGEESKKLLEKFFFEKR